MISLAHLWLPILFSGIGVFIASFILHVVLKFWHMPDYHGFSNESEVATASDRPSSAATHKGLHHPDLPFISPFPQALKNICHALRRANRPHYHLTASLGAYDLR